MRVSHCFVESRPSRCIKTGPSRLEWETRASHSETDRMRVSHFGADRTWTLRCWRTWDSRSEIEVRSSRWLKETRVWTSHSESTEEIASVESSIYYRWAWYLHQCSTFWLNRRGCWEPLVTKNCWVCRGEGRRYWSSLSLWSCANAFTLRVSWDVDVGCMGCMAPRSRRYGDATATYIRRSELPLRIYAKHQYKQESEAEAQW